MSLTKKCRDEEKELKNFVLKKERNKIIMVTFLVFATIVLLFMVLVLIARASELTADLKNGKVDYTSQSKWNGYFLLGFLVFMFSQPNE